MKLTVFAATGGTGAQILEQAVTAGHDVTAVVRNPAALTREVRTLTADLSEPDEATLVSAVAGADAVLSGLGPRERSQAGIASRGTEAIIRAMEAAGTERLLVISGAGVSTAPTPGRPNPPKREQGAGLLNQWVFTPMARRLVGANFLDVALMEERLRESSLNWTAARLPRLTDGPLTSRYRTAYERNVVRGTRLSRADGAHFMLQAIDDPGAFRRAVAVAY